MQILLNVCAVTSALMLKQKTPHDLLLLSSIHMRIVLLASHTAKSITSNILSKSTINRINFHRDLWMLCDVTFFVGRKICERKKTELKIDSSNQVTGANNQHTTKDCRMFYTRKVYIRMNITANDENIFQRIL